MGRLLPPAASRGLRLQAADPAELLPLRKLVGLNSPPSPPPPVRLQIAAATRRCHGRLWRPGHEPQLVFVDPLQPQRASGRVDLTDSTIAACLASTQAAGSSRPAPQSETPTYAKSPLPRRPPNAWPVDESPLPERRLGWSWLFLMS